MNEQRSGQDRRVWDRRISELTEPIGRGGLPAATRTMCDHDGMFDYETNTCTVCQPFPDNGQLVEDSRTKDFMTVTAYVGTVKVPGEDGRKVDVYQMVNAIGEVLYRDSAQFRVVF